MNKQNRRDGAARDYALYAQRYMLHIYSGKNQISNLAFIYTCAEMSLMLNTMFVVQFYST